ncbi:GDSL esterase/lipase At2g40250 [Elaeis guineensis]|uniref:GDSL esterase/lipase At2g40250 n=1 Tax=Elaeis guineensis var. tenera TaxID=51953 RepID=UPI003C6D1470
MENRKLAICFLLFSTLLSLFPHFAAAEPSKNISAVFAFGDSTLDAGNNNDLSTLVRADHPPYGRDFPGQVPTGRFTNGKLITDFLVSSLGLRDVLPSHSDRSLAMANLTTGVSFASGGSGLDDLTATTSGVTTVGRQVANFAAYIERLEAAVGNDEASRIIKDAMFVIGAGSNDMMMNYYILPARRMTFSTVSSYQRFLLSQLQKLVMVFLFPPLLAAAFFVFFWKYNAAIIQHGSKKIRNSRPSTGFTETNLGCCGTGSMEMGPLCNPLVPTCPFPNRFMFWDSVHPSQATYQALAKQFMETVMPEFRK